MTILNISLCLPEFDVAALAQGESIVAITQRFIVPEKSFLLLPCRDYDKGIYHAHIQNALESVLPDQAERIVATHWAQCSLCQPVPDAEGLDFLSDRTIWTQAALRDYIKTRKRLFLSFLNVYELSEPLPVAAEPVCAQLYKFLPLPQSIEGDTHKSVLTPEAFATAKENILNPKSQDDSAEEPETEVDDSGEQDILQDPKWVSKISKVGNSSDGHTFEKLVRKGLLELGFSNTLNRAEASLDPNATGGAGGIDFYADQPYPIVGECKASRHDRIRSDAATQVVRLGLQNLKEEDYLGCIKIVVSGGALTTGAENIAKGHRINVIKPETIQRLVESKIDFSDHFDLFQLKSYLEAEPFGEAADQKMNRYIDWCQREWQEKQEYRQLAAQSIQVIKELSQQSIFPPSQDFSAVEIRTHHNAKYEPIVTASKIEKILESQLYAADSEINRRRHQNGDVGYYLRSVE